MLSITVSKDWILFGNMPLTPPYLNCEPRAKMDSPFLSIFGTRDDKLHMPEYKLKNYRGDK